MLPTTSTVISTADDPTRFSTLGDTLSLDPSSDDLSSDEPTHHANPARKSAKSRLGARAAGPVFDFTGKWWLDPQVIPHLSARVQISKEFNKYKKTVTKMEYGLKKKNEEINTLRLDQSRTLENLKNETERVLSKQRAKIVELERNNENLERKLKKKSKRVKKLKNMFVNSSDSSE